MKLEALDHVALAVRDVERSARWYAETLGLKRQHEGMWNGRPVFVGNGSASIALFASDRSDAGRPGKPAILHFAFRTTREQFTAAQVQLEDRQVPFEFQDHEISHSIYLRDPDNHEVEITTYEMP